VTQVTLAGFGSDWWPFRLSRSGRGVSRAVSARVRAWPPAPDAVMGLRESTRALLAASLDKTLPKLLAQ
jgi:hypothetical protein